MNLKRLISVARGKTPADLILANARILNSFTGEIEEGNVAISEGRVAGIGEYGDARRTVDLRGQYLSPGLIDGHVHLESSLLHVDQYARAVVPHGTLAAVTDLHEIANVAGLRGIRYIMDCARRLPLDLFFTAPSCVPSTEMETGGARLDPDDLRQLLRRRNVVGLGEMMDFAGVLNADGQTLAKLQSAGSRPRDGHAPSIRGKELNGYLCPGIGSDHESTELEEGREKLRRGLHLMIREGSAERNLEALLPLVDDNSFHRCMLVVDDRDPLDLSREGDLDAVVRKAIRLGLDPLRAVQMASLNTARYFRLEGLGAIAPGYHANLLVLSDLEQFRIEEVYYRGKLVAREGQPAFRTSAPRAPWINNSVQIRPFTPEQLSLKAPATDSFPVIEIVPGQILTRRVQVTPRQENGTILPDPHRDLLKLVVVERHHATGNLGIGLVKGFGLRRGALGSSLAHDSHNIVAVGASDEDLYAVVKQIESSHGGLACAVDGRVVASLALPIAGLLSTEPLEAVVQKLEALEQAAQDSGCTVPSPFSILSFLALPVVPELRLTDRGLVDVVAGRLIT
ncbi:MAG: adenine deaminase [Chloroflexota bacterium]